MNEHVQFVELLSYLRKYMLVMESVERTNLSDFYVALVVMRIGLSEPNVLVVDLGTHYLEVLVIKLSVLLQQCVCNTVSHSCFKNCVQFSV